MQRKTRDEIVKGYEKIANEIESTFDVLWCGFFNIEQEAEEGKYIRYFGIRFECAEQYGRFHIYKIHEKEDSGLLYPLQEDWSCKLFSKTLDIQGKTVEEVMEQLNIKKKVC